MAKKSHKETTKEIFGADLSLNHGAVVKVEFGKENKIIPVTSWSPKSKFALGMKSPTFAVWATVDMLMGQVGLHRDKGKHTILAVDWSPSSVYWSGRKAYLIQVAFLMGLLYQQAVDRNINLQFVSSQKLRSWAGFAAGIPKVKVQEAVLAKYPLEERFLVDMTEDQIDAYIVAVYIKDIWSVE